MDEKRIMQKNRRRGMLVFWAVLTVFWLVLQAANLLYVVAFKPSWWLRDPQIVLFGAAVALLPPLLFSVVLIALYLAGWGFKGGRG
jgi:hypothetical protein